MLFVTGCVVGALVFGAHEPVEFLSTSSFEIRTRRAQPLATQVPLRLRQPIEDLHLVAQGCISGGDARIQRADLLVQAR